MGIVLISIIIFLPLLNITNLNTSRIIERYNEIALRRSVGATRKDIIVQFISESILISFVGGILAFVGAWLILTAINTSELLGYSNFKIDFKIFLNGLGIIFIFGSLAGLYPAIRMSKLPIISAMKGGSK
jgi:putative ABC transport system permease protein